MIREINTLADAQIVRMIRNSIKGYMTRDAKHITPADQKLWYETKPDTTKLYLLTELDAPIGYAMLRLMHGKVWGTLGVLEEFWNNGYGTILYTHMCNFTPELWIEIYADNRASLIAALKVGFEIVNVGDKIITLVKTRQ